MPINQCSNCRSEGRVLEELSRGSSVNYYRCECGHVWTVSRHERRERWDVTCQTEGRATDTGGNLGSPVPRVRV